MREKPVSIKKYKCNNCTWQGIEQELEYDITDTCFGDDKIEMCPKCGSYEVALLQVNN